MGTARKICLKLGALAILLTAFLCILCFNVFAEEDYNGYLVKLKESPASLMSTEETDCMEEVWAEERLYTIQEDELPSLLESGMVESYEPNYRVTLAEAPNDPEFGQQWNMTLTNFPAAWKISERGKGVRVAVIDSGISSTHPDLKGVAVKGHNFLDKDHPEDTEDNQDHGTFVSGLIAANFNNGIGIAGGADVTIVPLKTFELGKKTYTSDIIPAIIAAVDDPAYECDIINMSFETPGNADFENAIQYAAEKGKILIAAAGNEKDGDVTTLKYPAAYDEVIGVGAVDKYKQWASFSRYNNSVFICAPGKEVYSTCIGEKQYRTGNGTSFAAPLVTAAAAILKEIKPDLTIEEFKKLLISTSVDLGASGRDDKYGYGLLDVNALVMTQAVTTNDNKTLYFPAKLTPETSQNERQVTRTYTNITKDELTSFYHIVAIYSEQRELKQINSTLVEGKAGSKQTVTDSVTLAEGDTVKVLTWDSLNQMRPLKEVQVLK